MSTMTGLIPGCCHRHIRAFESEVNPRFAKKRLRVRAAMTTTPVGCLPMGQKLVKASELPGHAEQNKQRPALEDSASQDQDSSKESMFKRCVATLNTCGVELGENLGPLE
jgi:hypothetical protein